MCFYTAFSTFVVINNRDRKYLKAFGKRLKYLREEKGLSKSKLADEANLGRNQILKIEEGEINTTVSTLKALAEVLGVEPKDLLDF
jgi:transcriptional regulator with XRE-family HTH domain